MDIAVTFCRGPIGVTDVSATGSFRLTPADTIYLILGEPSRMSGDLAYFALWSSGPLDLKELARELSERFNPLCVVWKSDSGGVGGYESFAFGRSTACERAAERAWMLPPTGVEQTFNEPLKIRQRDRMCFPEFLFDVHMTCYRWRGKPAERSPELMGGDTVRSLLHGELGVSPVFPFAPVGA